jgi:amidophosphoribosyltransferase
VTLRATSDSEVIAAMIANDESPSMTRSHTPCERLEGRYSVVALSRERSSPSAIRTASARSCSDGSRAGNNATAGSSPRRRARSTSSAPSTCATSSRGERVLVDEDGLRSVQAVQPADAGSLCIFEFFYLARPDTQLAGRRGARRAGPDGRAARRGGAGRRRPRAADPDSGTPAAIGFSRALGDAVQRGLIKNRYVARTFIQPEQGCASRACG